MEAKPASITRQTEPFVQGKSRKPLKSSSVIQKGQVFTRSEQQASDQLKVCRDKS